MEPGDVIRIGEKLHAIDTTLTRLTIEISNLTSKVGTQNGRIAKVEDRQSDDRITHAVEMARVSTRSEVEAGFRKRDIAVLGAAWTGALVVAEILFRKLT